MRAEEERRKLDLESGGRSAAFLATARAAIGAREPGGAGRAGPGAERSAGGCEVGGSGKDGSGERVGAVLLAADVYAIARHANRERMHIPENTITKPPSAELAADQLDSDDLPDYDILDNGQKYCFIAINTAFSEP